MNKVLIYTVVDENYKEYIPLFIKACKHSCPNYDVQIAYMGKEDLGFDGIVFNRFSEYPRNVATASSLRFASEPVDCNKYDYIYITDIDMILLAEKSEFHIIHKELMNKACACYENFAVAIQNHGYRMPGVHFVNRFWWENTQEQRNYYMKELSDEKSAKYREYDECMLYRIVNDSGLKWSAKGHEDWRWHGIHIGRYLKHGDRKPIKKCNDGMEIERINKLLNDKELFNIVLKESETSPNIRLALSAIIYAIS